MQQRKSKKILIYFFLLIILGSVNNLSLSKIKFNKVENINISGLDSSNSAIIQNDLKSLNLGSIFFLDENSIGKVIDSNTLIQKYKIFKEYPSTLDIEIEKTDFLAKINQEGKTFIIGSNGKLIKNNSSINNLPFIFGNPDISEFLNLKKIIDSSNILYDEIENFYFFKSNRWDVELKNNILIKLSKDNLKISLNNAFKLLNNINLENIKVIDARIKNQIILND
ncbi:cell division protein FtsQ/DivIB [Candidatus Pelagibacter sp. FZCC0015]|uniref:cell division protein FtsQ/DivIB n=1 Tax=Candidatus Pelagibacter sp. FZCC0015 TaxID=2268451 RepID=UPI0011A9B250|nr:FtsQ-type POTRA domain-containing protein [Candidatus Pelagibacter sp. FZCC0015]